MKNLQNIILLIFFLNITGINAHTVFVSNSSASDYSSIEEVNIALQSGIITDTSSILFKCGDIFSGTLEITANYIIIDKWDTGVNPIFDGMKIFDYGIINGPQNNLEWGDYSNISIQNIELRNYNEAGIRIVNSNDWIIDNVLSHDNGIQEWNSFENCNFEKVLTSNSGEGIQITGKNITVKNCTVYNNGNHGIYVSTFHPSRYVENITIENNTIFNNHHSSIDLKNKGGPNYGIKNVVIRYNEIFDNFDNDGANYLRESGITIIGHTVEQYIENVDVIYNQISDVRGIGIFISGAARNIKLHNNTLANIKASAAIAVRGENNDYHPSNIEIFNNIGYNEPIYAGYGDCNSGNPAIYVENSSQIMCDNNIWFNENNLYNYWENNSDSFFGDKNIFSDPKLNSDFTLKKDSPAISQGMNIGYTTDKLKNLIGNPPDIGAYEFNDIVSVYIEDKSANLTDEFILFNNFPNPFNGQTKLKFKITNSGHVKLTIYNLLGQKIAELVNSFLPSGIYEINYHPENLSSGTYVYTISTGNSYLSKKMIILE